MHPIEVTHAHVRKGALDLEVVAALDTLYVSEEQAQRVLGLLPNLASHVCVNSAGNDTFGDELVGTETPHLLEHVMIELMGKAEREADARTPQLGGHTSWLEELDATAPDGYALMRVTVTFANDFTALAAMGFAIDVVTWTCGPASSAAPDIDSMIDQLAAIR